MKSKLIAFFSNFVPLVKYLQYVPFVLIGVAIGYPIGHHYGWEDHVTAVETEKVVSDNKVMLEFINRQMGIYDDLQAAVDAMDKSKDGPVAPVLKLANDGLRLPAKTADKH